MYTSPNISKIYWGTNLETNLGSSICSSVSLLPRWNRHPTGTTWSTSSSHNWHCVPKLITPAWVPSKTISKFPQRTRRDSTKSKNIASNLGSRGRQSEISIWEHTIRHSYTYTQQTSPRCYKIPTKAVSTGHCKRSCLQQQSIRYHWCRSCYCALLAPASSCDWYWQCVSKRKNIPANIGAWESTCHNFRATFVGWLLGFCFGAQEDWFPYGSSILVDLDRVEAIRLVRGNEERIYSAGQCSC